METDVNLLDLAADHEGRGAPRALGRRLPEMVAQLLRAAGIRARHASATVAVGVEGDGGGAGGENPSRLGWAVPAGVLDEGLAVELSRRIGPARFLAFGQLGPTGHAGALSLELRVLRRDDAAEVLRLDRELFEEEVADVAHGVARALAELLGLGEAVVALDPAAVLGSRDAAAILSLHEGLDALAAAEGGVAGGDAGRAVELLIGALDRDPSCGTARDHALAAVAAHAGAAIPLDRAVELARQLADRSGDDRGTTLLVARLLHRRHEPARAREVLVDALLRCPGDATLVVELARILLGIGEYGEAAARCRDALERAAGEPLASPVVEADLHEGLGLALAKAGDLGDARAQLERALELEPGRARAWANLGRCHHLLGEPERAAEAYERSLALDPDCWEAARNFAELLVERRETGRAEALLRIWAAHQPEDPHAVLSLGELLTAAPGREDDAATVLAAALERHPDDPRIHALLGGILTQTGELARAERHYREALRLDPGDPALMSNLAVVLSQRGALREAEQLARQAVEVDPHDPISRKIFDHVRKLN